MMKSAIDWLMGKSDSFTINNEINTAQPSTSYGSGLSKYQKCSKESVKSNTVVNGGYRSDGISMAATSHCIPHSVNVHDRSNDHKPKSPWGQSLTPRNAHRVSASIASQNLSQRSNSIYSSPNSHDPNMSWEDINFSSELASPGFASRIAKEVENQRREMKKYPNGQEKFIRAGALPNVRLVGRSKPVISVQSQPKSLLSSPASNLSSSLTSGFLSSASTRMPDMSSVVSLLDSTPGLSGSDAIRDPASVDAVVAALEQAQALKSGIKRNRHGETEDVNKKQKFYSNSDEQEKHMDFSTPIMNQVFGTGTKRTLDSSASDNDTGVPSLSPSNQLSPENKRRCIPDPRIASFSSYKNVNNNALSLQGSGRDTPYSLFDSQRDSDSESNRSLDSHHSRQSDRSSKGQNNLDGAASLVKPSHTEPPDRSGSQTPQSFRGSYGVGRTSNGGSSSSSRTTTPSSRLSHTFTLDAYKADKAKGQQRLNKMLGMLFHVTEEMESKTPVAPVSTSSSEITAPSNSICSTSTASVSLPPSTFKIGQTVTEPTPVSKEAEKTDVPSFGFALSKIAAGNSSNAVSNVESKTTESDVITSVATTSSINVSKETEPAPQLPSYKEAVSLASSSGVSVSATTTAPPPAYSSSAGLFNFGSSIAPQTASSDKVDVSKEDSVKVSSPGLSFPSIASISSTTKIVSPSFTMPQSSLNPGLISPNVTSSSNPLQALKETTQSISKPLFNFGSSSSKDNEADTSKNTSTVSSSASLFNFGASTVPSATSQNVTSSITSIVKETSPTSSNLFSFGSSSVTTESNLNKSVSFSTVTSQSGAVATTAISSASIGLFKFGDVKSTQSNSSAADIPSQSIGGSMFSFGANSTTPTTSSSENKLPGQTNLFPFGQSSSNTGSGFSFPKTTDKTSSDSGFSFSTKPDVPATVASTNAPLSSGSMFSFGSMAKSTAADALSSSSSKPTASVFSFGGPNPVPKSVPASQPTTAPGGFSFGSSNPSQSENTPTTSSPAASGLFSFGSSNSQKGSSAPFQFGSPATTTVSSAPEFGGNFGGGFSFGSNKPAQQNTQSSTSAATFGTPATSSSTFAFNTSAPKSSGFDFASKTTETSSSASNVFTFGSGAPAQGPMFGSPTSTAFGASTTKSSTFSFGAQAAPAFGADTPSGPAKSLFGSGSNAAPSFGGGAGSGSSVAPSFGSGAGSRSNAAPSFGGGAGSAASTAPSFGSGTGSRSNPAPSFGGGAGSAASTAPSFGSGTRSRSNPAPSFGGGAGSAASTAPAFGSGSSTALSFGSGASSGSNAFGSSATSPFGSGQASSPFNNSSQTPNFGSSFGSSTNNPVSPPNPFQPAPQNANSSGGASVFNFGQSAAQPQQPAGIFQFGSQGASSGMAPSFGQGGSSGGFNFGGGPAVMGGAPAGNPFNITSPAASTDSPAGPRRIKSRVHRRR